MTEPLNPQPRPTSPAAILLLAAGLPCFYWAAAVLGASFAGFPGAVCMTPAAWLLGIPAGIRAASLSFSSELPARRRLAGLAGALVGGFQAGLGALVVGLFDPASGKFLFSAGRLPGSQPSALFVFLLLAGIGIPICACLAVIFASLHIRKNG